MNMKALPTGLQLLVSMLALLATSCDKKTEQTSSLDTIDLLRGEITLCGPQKFGEVSFAQSCEPQIREKFDLGLALLHSFEYDEAEKAFVQVIDADPECAMAYWGVAMSNFHSLWFQSGTDYLEKGTKILEAAQAVPKSERENDYLHAISAFYQDWEKYDHRTRVKKFEQRMRQVYEKYSDDKEAAIFYALALRASADPSDKTYKNQIESGKILESIFPGQPNHPGIAHYIIHNYDYPELAQLALPTARRYAEIAPASAHAQHMPSHIFTRLGLWEESIDSNINSMSSALCYSESIDPDAHWDEELHSMDYLVYAYLQIGNNEKAIEQYNYLKTFKKVFPENFKVAYTAAAVPTRIALENKDWKAAANLQLPSIGINWDNFPWQKAIMHFGRALGSVHLGNLIQAENELSAMVDLNKQLLDMQDGYKANQVLIQIKTIQAWMAFAKEKQDVAIRLMAEAVEMENNTTKNPVTPGEVLPTGDLMGDLLMELGRPEEALEAYETDLAKYPNRFNGIYGAATAAVAISNHEKATKYFKLLIDLTQNSNSQRSELIQAREYMTKI